MDKVQAYQDSIRGCLFGGAAGDALGYTVEFLTLNDIYGDYGLYGITGYEYNKRSGQALISDDTQMTLFTANGLLVGQTRGRLRGIAAPASHYIALAYKDWYMTQTVPFPDRAGYISWLCDQPEMYNRRAPGMTCLNALEQESSITRDNYIAPPLNNSKGCGGVMRVAPLALVQWQDMGQLMTEAAQTAAITHGHPLGYLPAAVLCYIIHRIVFPADWPLDLEKLVLEATDGVCCHFAGTPYLEELKDIIHQAVELSHNQEADTCNIRSLGQGWVAEEALAIAIYCALRYPGSFSAGIIAAVNHDGDSDSTGAIAGNILGAIAGYDGIDLQWKQKLELAPVILEMADDLCAGCPPEHRLDPTWERKYCNAQWRA